MFRVEFAYFFAVFFNGDFAFTGELSMPVKHGDFIFFHQTGNALGELACHAARTRHDFFQIEFDVLGA